MCILYNELPETMRTTTLLVWTGTTTELQLLPRPRIPRLTSANDSTLQFAGGAFERSLSGI